MNLMELLRPKDWRRLLGVAVSIGLFAAVHAACALESGPQGENKVFGGNATETQPTEPQPTPAPTNAPTTTQWAQSTDLAQGAAFGFGFLFGKQTVLMGGSTVSTVDENGTISFIPTKEAFAGSRTQLWRPYPKADLPIPMWGYFAHLNGMEDLLVSLMSSSQRIAADPEGLVYIAETDEPEKGLVWTASAPLARSGLGLPVRRRAGFFSVMDIVIFMGGVDADKKFQPEIISYNRTSKKWAVDTLIPNSTFVNSICDCQVQVLKACLVSAICSECDAPTNHSGGGNRRYKAIHAVYDPCRRKVKAPTVLPFHDPIISFDTTRVGHFLVSMVGLLTPPPSPPTSTPTATPPSSSTPTDDTTTLSSNETTKTEVSTNNVTTSETVSTTPRPTRPPPGPDNDFKVMLYYTDLFNLEQFPSNNQNLRKRFGGTLYSEGSSVYYAGGFRDLTRTSFSTAVDVATVVPPIYLAIDRASRRYTVGEEIPFTTESFHPGMTVRLALSPQCTFAVPGTNDAIVMPGNDGNGKGTLGNVTYDSENLYLCVSNGVCNQDTRYSTPCRRGHNAQANFESCIMSRCCWVKGSCYEFESGAEQYFMLASPPMPITVLPPPTPDDSNPDAKGRLARFFSSVGGIVIIAFCSAAFVVLCLIFAVIVLSRRSKAKMSSYDEEDEAHALEPSGKYKVVRKLGQGGFGSVFLMKRRSDGKELALKHMICPSADERDYAIKEFQLLHNAQGHENMIHLEEMLVSWGVDNLASVVRDSAVVHVGINGDSRDSDANQQRGSKAKRLLSDDEKNPLLPLLKASSRYVCIIMEYCEEGDLARLMLNTPKYRRGLPEKMVIGYAKQICSLLMHLHSREPPIVHRDLKPENVLLKNKATQVVLTDFGLAQQLERSYMTTRAGTLHFIAPECWKKHYTASVDMWSLGCILWACCTGRVTNATARVMFKDARSPTFEVEINHELRDYSKILRRVVIGLLKIKTDQRLTAQQALDLLDLWRDSAEER